MDEPAVAQAGDAQIADCRAIPDNDRILSGSGSNQQVRRFGVPVYQSLVQQRHFRRVVVGARPLCKEAFHFFGLSSSHRFAETRSGIEKPIQEHISLLCPRIRRRALRGQSPENDE